MDEYIEAPESIQLMIINNEWLNEIFGKCPSRSLQFFLRLKHLFGCIKEIKHLRSSGLKRVIFQIDCRIHQSKIQNHHPNYDFDLADSEIKYSAKNKVHDGRIAVYTAIYGKYDRLREPLYVSPYCDYYAFTDQIIPKESTWKNGNALLTNDFFLMDGYHKARFIKMFPHLLFGDYQYSIWIDGNVIVVADLYPLVDRSMESYIAMFDNPLHDCTYTEANYIIFRCLADYEAVKKQMLTYKKEGFPSFFGMRETSIVVRKHLDPRCISLMEQWWQEINQHTMRDQLSLFYLLWKNSYFIDMIQSLGGFWKRNPRFKESTHLWHYTI